MSLMVSFPQTDQPERVFLANISSRGPGETRSTNLKNSSGFSLCFPRGQLNQVPIVFWKGFPRRLPFLQKRICSVLHWNLPTPHPGLHHVIIWSGSNPQLRATW